MSASAAAVNTASITPELFREQSVRSPGRALVVSALAVLMLFGFGLRAYRLGAEGLSEDELNKVRAVEEYRSRGLSSTNGEHPFLMKAMLTVSIVLADRWNALGFAHERPALHVSTETAVRLPGALFGSLTALLIFLVMAELFGAEAGLLAAMLWAFDPAAVGFNRIAKEDSFLVFFFLLANVFWLRGQRVAEAGDERPERYYWAAAVAFGAMMASKYMPHFLAVSVAYYYIFQGIERTRWRMGKRKWLIFFAVMGAAFLVCNPTILLPGTWHEMRIFAGEKRIGHDSYEFMGNLYRNRMTLWLNGSPWYFYYVFIGVKLPVPVILAFIAGLPLLFLKRLGDGRYFILFWLFFWFFPFTVLGGKFTRYFTFALPAVLMTASLGIQAGARGIARLSTFAGAASRQYVRVAFAPVVVSFSLYASVSAAPHYRLYTNFIGGGRESAGSYFPHDEFYDASMREAVSFAVQGARHGARLASESPDLVTYYARSAARDDIVAVSLSDRAALRALSEGDVIIVARGRRYFSNDAVTSMLLNKSRPASNIKLGDVSALQVFVLDTASLELMSGIVKE